MNNENIKLEDLHKKDKLWFARIIPNIDYYGLLEVSVVSVNIEEKYCVVTEKKSKQSFLLNKNEAEQLLFKDKKYALKYLSEQRGKR